MKGCDKLIGGNIEKPIYLQVVDFIENEILEDRLVEQDQVPSTNDFARIYDINPATARKGLNILVDEKILYKKRGLGMFVEKDARSKVKNKRKKDYFESVLPHTIKEAYRLDIPINEILEFIKKWSDDNE